MSADQASFDPYAYQLGAVWPHDNSIIAMGFKRYGFHADAAQVARYISGAASYFQGNQLPQLYAGIQKDGTNFPMQYLGANVPHAWAASSAFLLLQAMLGVVPDAPHKSLFVDPALPAWMPDVTLSNLKVGQSNLSIRFWRDGEDTKHEELAGDPVIVKRRPFASASFRLLRTKADAFGGANDHNFGSHALCVDACIGSYPGNI